MNQQFAKTQIRSIMAPKKDSGKESKSYSSSSGRAQKKNNESDSSFVDLMVNQAFGIDPITTIRAKATGMTNDELRFAQFATQGQASQIVNDRLKIDIMGQMMNASASTIKRTKDEVTKREIMQPQLQSIGMYSPMPSMYGLSDPVLPAPGTMDPMIAMFFYGKK